MSVLVDTSIWIDYFRNGDSNHRLDYLIDENIVVTNNLILAELIPFLKIKKQKKIVELLLSARTKMSIFRQGQGKSKF